MVLQIMNVNGLTLSHVKSHLQVFYQILLNLQIKIIYILLSCEFFVMNFFGVITVLIFLIVFVTFRLIIDRCTGA